MVKTQPQPHNHTITRGRLACIIATLREFHYLVGAEVIEKYIEYHRDYQYRHRRQGADRIQKRRVTTISDYVMGNTDVLPEFHITNSELLAEELLPMLREADLVC